jgi:hypothetical protein
MVRGDIKVSVPTEKMRDDLLLTEKLGEWQVKGTKPRWELKKDEGMKGVIRGAHGMSVRMIMEELREQGVSEVVPMGVNGTYRLNFVGVDKLPEAVWLYQKHAVQVFVEGPTQCYQCLGYNHVRAQCRGKERCRKCGAEGHGGSTCTSMVSRCAVCQGPHSAGAGVCPRQQHELNVLVTAQQENRPIQEVRARMPVRDVRVDGRNFANVVGGGGSRADTQQIPVVIHGQVVEKETGVESRLDRLEKMVENLVQTVKMLVGHNGNQSREIVGGDNGLEAVGDERVATAQVREGPEAAPMELEQVKLALTVKQKEVKTLTTTVAHLTGELTKLKAKFERMAEGNTAVKGATNVNSVAASSTGHASGQQTTPKGDKDNHADRRSGGPANQSKEPGGGQKPSGQEKSGKKNNGPNGGDKFR